MSSRILSLKVDSPELKAALLDGSLWQENRLWKVLPREVASCGGHGEGLEPRGSVIFEASPAESFQAPKWWRVALRATRPFELGLTLGPFFSVLLSGAWGQGWSFSPLGAALVFFSILFLQISVQLLNDVEDHLRLVDRPGTVGGSGVIQNGWASARTLRSWGWGFWMAAILTGLPLLGASSPFLVALGLAGVLGVALFSVGPWALKYRALGDLCVFLLTGPALAVGVSEALFQQWSASQVDLGLFFGFLNWAVFHSKHLQSFEADRLKGALNFAHWLGFKRSRYGLVILYGLAFTTLLVGYIRREIPSDVIFLLIWGSVGVVKQTQRLFRSSGPVSVYLSEMKGLALSNQIILTVSVMMGFMNKF